MKTDGGKGSMRNSYHMYGDIAISTWVRIKRLEWAGHVIRMEDSRIPKKIITARFEGGRRRGRPRARWEDMVREDTVSMLGVRVWR